MPGLEWPWIYSRSPGCASCGARQKWLKPTSYSVAAEAKEAMFFYTDTADAPWTVVKSNDKKRARIEALAAAWSVPVRIVSGEEAKHALFRRARGASVHSSVTKCKGQPATQDHVSPRETHVTVLRGCTTPC